MLYTLLSYPIITKLELHSCDCCQQTQSCRGKFSGGFNNNSPDSCCYFNQDRGGYCYNLVDSDGVVWTVLLKRKWSFTIRSFSRPNFVSFLLRFSITFCLYICFVAKRFMCCFCLIKSLYGLGALKGILGDVKIKLWRCHVFCSVLVASLYPKPSNVTFP